MSVGHEPLLHQKLRAPQAHGESLIAPPLAEVAALLTENRHLLAQSGGDWQTWLAARRSAAREEMVAAALTYTRQYRDVAIRSYDSATPLLLAGHQPQLFHPGVWLKNFVLSSLAESQAAIGINLIVDNDAIRTASIRVPVMSGAQPALENVPYDDNSEEIPYEQRSILNDEVFESFPTRVAEMLSGQIDQPLVRELWPQAIAARRRTNNLGEAIANARHALEGTWNQHTLELPLSHVCSQNGFRGFVVRLLRDLAAFHAVYNASLAEYRTANRIRSRAHPVPDLAVNDDWLETPLWIWMNSAPRRKRLFVRTTPAGLELSDFGELRYTLPLTHDDSIAAWQSLEAEGIKIRPRALLTTMYARLVLSDLFLHGIGGAKYDELTDIILSRYFGVEPPGYLTVTATIQLPLQYPRVTHDDVLAIDRRQRDLRFHAERVVSDGRASPLVARKQELLQAIPPRGMKRAWHRELTSLNETLFQSAESELVAARRAAAVLGEQHRAARLLGSREFAYCLFPADFLRNLLLDLSRGTA